MSCISAFLFYNFAFTPPLEVFNPSAQVYLRSACWLQREEEPRDECFSRLLQIESASWPEQHVLWQLSRLVSMRADVWCWHAGRHVHDAISSRADLPSLRGAGRCGKRANKKFHGAQLIVSARSCR